MALSGSIDFTLTRDQIITDALKECGVLEAGETAASADMSDGAQVLNRMVKTWQASGIHLWKETEAVLFLTVGTVQYAIGAGGDHCTTAGDAVKTELAADAASGAGTVTVDDDTGIANADVIGIELDDGTLQWTTVNGAPAANVITLTDTLTGAASTDNHVYAYTSLIDRPLRIMNPRRRDEADNDVPVEIVSRGTYFETPNKTNQGKATQVYYDPQLTDGQMYLWPAPDDVKDRIYFTAHLPIQDFDASTNNADFPQEWLDALVWNLAFRLSTRYGVPTKTREELKEMALMTMQTVQSWDAEPGSVFFEPDMTGAG